MLCRQVLVLNQSYEPISICSPQKAVILLFLTKAELIASNQNFAIRTVSHSYPFPSVIRLRRYIRFPFKKVELSRKNIFRRDGNMCQYCGSKLGLTIDHIFPKSRGGEDSWDNLVTACKVCNNMKGNRTPEEADMHLNSEPARPHHIIFLRQYVANPDDTWKPFLFM